MQSLSLRAARRLALARSGFLGTRWSSLPARARGRGRRSLAALEAVVARFGYLQLDTVAVAGARSHALVLLSRLEGLDASWCEQLLATGRTLFRVLGPRSFLDAPGAVPNLRIPAQAVFPALALVE